MTETVEQNGQPFEKDEKGRFKSGNIGGPGRPKGARNKLGEQFVADLYTDWQKHGSKVIADVREKEPAAYMRVIASIVPKEMIVREGAPLDELTDDELLEHLVALRSILVAGTRTKAGRRDRKAQRDQEAGGVAH